MSETKFTPGPWIYDIHEHSFYIFTVEVDMVADGDPDDVGIARMRGTGRGADVQEQEANAQLISAAPQLLEACRVVLAYLDSLEEKIPDPIDPDLANLRRRHKPLRDKLQPAIAKAEGAK